MIVTNKNRSGKKNISPLISYINKVGQKIIAFSLLLCATLLTSCDTPNDGDKDYLTTFNITFGIIMGVLIAMVIFGAVYSRRRLREDKAEERRQGTGTPTR